MHYLGLDVHTSTISYCLLNDTGEIQKEGKVATTSAALLDLVGGFRALGSLTIAQEIGAQSQLIFDILQEVDVKLLSFNAQHLRMIAASRKKSDRRDAYWLARTIQTGMTPHPVYIPTGQVRLIRSLLVERRTLVAERKRHYLRAHHLLRKLGFMPKRRKRIALIVQAHNLDASMFSPHHWAMLCRCQRLEEALLEEIKTLQEELKAIAAEIEEVQLLQSIPGVALISSLTIYSAVGDISRFPNAKKLCAYAGLVPSVRQSGNKATYGQITKQGSPMLRSTLVQSAQVAVMRCRSEAAKPLQKRALRIKDNHGKTKVAIVATARHILKIAFYILRDKVPFDPYATTQETLVQQVEAA